ncbi:hypothetical protein LOD99_2134 [Oopsacas minuta]|uniref:Uncharacterized protein n=1 Tax=Oopsacas minuta TaxID=111878 RepID=A0AAV7K3K8_9METZ|nr:hypothetical protein LOD99_2134 [Oopsacas minuta]
MLKVNIKVLMLNLETKIKVNSLIIDNIGPSLVSFFLDLDREILYLTFNDVVNTTTLDPTKITFQQSKIDLSQLDDANSYSLTGGFTNSSLGFVIDFVLSFQDINELKSRPFLANNINDTYVSVTAATIDDVNAINVFAIPPIEAIQSTQVYPDISPPKLESFTLNMDSGIILLTFSEVIHLGTLDITHFSLVPYPYSDSVFHVPLTGAIVFDFLYKRIFLIELSEIDLNRVKYSTTLATNLHNTYSIISGSLISDVYENPVSQIFIEDPLIVSVFVPDTTSPNLVLFTLDMDKGTLYLRFDEIVNVSTFDPAKIQLSNFNGIFVYTISDGEYVTEVIIFNLLRDIAIIPLCCAVGSHDVLIGLLVTRLVQT